MAQQCLAAIAQKAKGYLVDSKPLMADGYCKHISNIDHISSHSPRRVFACLTTNSLALGLYGQTTYSLCGFHKFLHTTLRARFPLPQDGRIISMNLNTSACIIFDPRTARTSGSFFGSYLPRPYPQARLYLWEMKLLCPSNWDPPVWSVLEP